MRYESRPFSGAPLVLADTLRKIEAEHKGLMKKAAAATAAFALKHLPKKKGRVLVLAGSGNNGADAVWAAHLLVKAGHHVVVFHNKKWGKAQSKEGRKAWSLWAGKIIDEIPDLDRFDLVIDGLFGVGIDRPFTQEFIHLANAINNRPRRLIVLAVDVPSGLSAFTGYAFPHTIRADHTLTFLALKPGLFTADGPDHCGSLHFANLDIANSKISRLTPGAIITVEHFYPYLRPRLKNNHKGNFGSLAVVGGARGMVGAGILCARAALRLGAGKVFLGLLDASLSIDLVQPELMMQCPEDALKSASCVAVGPGLGASKTALNLLKKSLTLPLPLLIDADGLNLLVATSLLALIKKRKAPTIITPHPGEAAHLLSVTTATVQKNRLSAAQALVRQTGAVVVLKGHGTIVATSTKWFVNTTGDSGLATAGSGDVLAGIIAALLAQKWPALEAALCGVHLHGKASLLLSSVGAGPIGSAASELIYPARKIFNGWCNHA